MSPTVRLNLKVAPKSTRNAVTGWIGGTLKLSVTAAPEKGKANQAVVGVLAKALGLPRSALRILRGETAPTKTVEISGLDEGEILRRLSKPAA